MYIPSHWSKETADVRTPDGREIPISAWGCAEDQPTAKANAVERLRRVVDRIRTGDPLPSRYAYGSRPLREEILQSFAEDGQAVAIVTRNAYGAQVLNTSTMLFLDVDRPPLTLRQRLPRWLGGQPAPSEDSLLAKLRSALQQHGNTTYRIYRTAAGFRALAVDREFDPTGDEAQSLMRTTGTDPAFARLCQVQRSFRARLTPKPWRCRVSLPPSEHPRLDDAAQQEFVQWLGEYEQSSRGYATCSYLETIGNAQPTQSLAPLVELHDAVTRCRESLPLA